LIAEALIMIGFSQPAIIAGYNVREKKTVAKLVAGEDCQDTRIGYLLSNTATALGGTVRRLEPIKDGLAWHLQAHVIYP